MAIESQIFYLNQKVPESTNGIYAMPEDKFLGRKGFMQSAAAMYADKFMYAEATGLNKQVVQDYLDAGLTKELEKAADVKTKESTATAIQETVNQAAKNQEELDSFVGKIQDLQASNEYLKKFISPATLAILQQSENPIARRAAARKVHNSIIAARVVQEKFEKANEESFVNNWDFVDTLASEIIPGVSTYNLSKRKELSNKFMAVMSSDEDPAIVENKLKATIDEAADQGFFTQDNRFFLNDFIGLALEGSQSGEAETQSLFAALDLLGGLDVAAVAGYKVGKTVGNVASDTARMLSFAEKDVAVVKEIIDDARIADDYVGTSTITANKENGVVVTDASRGEALTPVEATAMRLYEAENEVLRKTLDYAVRSGSAINEDALLAFKTEAKVKAKEIAEKSGNLRYVDTKIELDELDNIVQFDYFGTTKGRAFTSKVAAEKQAALLDGEVALVDGSTNQYVVVRKTNVATGEFSQAPDAAGILEDTRFYKATPTEELGSADLTSWLRSPLSQTTGYLNALLKRGEAQRSRALQEMDLRLDKKAKSVGRKGTDEVNSVWVELRDKTQSARRTDLTATEFEDTFRVLHGKAPTQAQKELFAETQDWARTDWLIKADYSFKQAVNRGFIMVKYGDLELAAVKSSKSSIPEGSLIWDDNSGKLIRIDGITDQQVFRLSEPHDFGAGFVEYYVSTTPRTRAITHFDALGYNAGGPRFYEGNQMGHFVKQETEVVLADGRKIEGTPKTLMAAKTEKEALKAVEEINAQLKVLHDAADPSIYKTVEEYENAVTALRKDSDINEAIAANSGWRPSVHSVDTLVELARDFGLDLRKPVQRVGADERIMKELDHPLGDITFNDVASSPGTLRNSRVRMDNVLMGYGGEPLKTVKPIEAIHRSYSSSVARATEAAYSAASINGVLRKAIEKGLLDNIAEIRNLPLRQKINKARIKTSSKEGKKLELERQQIIHRLNSRKDIFDAAIQRKKDVFANWLYDEGKKGLAAKVDTLSANPVSAMRGMTFDAMLGMFSVDQIYVQASQMSSIVATAEKTMGLRAVAAMPAVRLLIKNGDENVIRAASKHLGPAIDMEPEQFFTMVQELRMNGRVHVAASLADLGESSGGAIFMRKLREKGRVFFNEGELYARITSHITATQEYLAKVGPKADLTTNAARNWIANRDDVLTMGMTSTSRTPVENLPMAQFMSYTMRVVEQLFAGSLGGKAVLSGKQKFRLAAIQVAMYGVAVIPGVNVALDYLDFKNGIAPETGSAARDVYNTFKNGMLDSSIKVLFDIESELGRRLAWGEGIYQLFERMSDDNLYETLGGPSIQLGMSVWDGLNRTMFDIKTKNVNIETAFHVLRNIKTVNSSVNAYLAWAYGNYYTKTGLLVSSDISQQEAIATFFGVPLEKVNEVWRNNKFLKKDSNTYREVGKNISTLWDRLARAYQDSGGVVNEEVEEIHHSIALAYAPWSNTEIVEIDRFVNKDHRSFAVEQALRMSRNANINQE